MNANTESLVRALESGLPGDMADYLERSPQQIKSDILALIASGGKGLRDEFAMAALTGMLAHQETELDPTKLVIHMADVWNIADAMLAARSKQGEGA